MQTLICVTPKPVFHIQSHGVQCHPLMSVCHLGRWVLLWFLAVTFSHGLPFSPRPSSTSGEFHCPWPKLTQVHVFLPGYSIFTEHRQSPTCTKLKFGFNFSSQWAQCPPLFLPSSPFPSFVFQTVTVLRDIYKVTQVSRPPVTASATFSAIFLSLHSMSAMHAKVHKYPEYILYTIFGGPILHFTILVLTFSFSIITVDTAHGMCSRCVCLTELFEYKPRRE